MCFPQNAKSWPKMSQNWPLFEKNCNVGTPGRKPRRWRLCFSSLWYDQIIWSIWWPKKCHEYGLDDNFWPKSTLPHYYCHFLDKSKLNLCIYVTDLVLRRYAWPYFRWLTGELLLEWWSNEFCSRAILHFHFVDLSHWVFCFTRGKSILVFQF